MPLFFNLVMKLIALITLATLSLTSPMRNPVVESEAHSSREMSPRSANTCPDTSLAKVVYQSYFSPTTAHALDYHFIWVSTNSKQPQQWGLQGPAFKAWRTQQPQTVPLFRLNQANGNDYVVAIGADAQTPPVISGFPVTILLGWVFNTPDCGGVPLMSLVLPGASDHYYTTDPDERDGLVASSWTDGGIVAYVVPVLAL